MSDLFKSVDNSWTLFLDRDGVINKRPINDYVKSAATFEFLPGVLDAIKILTQKFNRILIVTNQQGIGKKLMSEEDLMEVNHMMLSRISQTGGRIDKVYHCPDLVTAPNNCRKPGDKMAQQAKLDFPQINFQKSIMVGDTESDIKFGENTGMLTVFINNSSEVLSSVIPDIEYTSLSDFAKSFIAND